MKKLFLFDFDGTITRRDTFLDFLLYDKGTFLFLLLLLRFIFPIIGYKLHIYDPEKLKLKLFNAFYLGVSKEELEAKGRNYIEARKNKLFYNTILDKYIEAIKKSEDVYVVSASLDVWLQFFVEEYGGKLICTNVAYKNGIYSGQFTTPNCNGEEKAKRIKEEINLDKYSDILAYGNSTGDDAMFSLATQSYKV